MRFSIFFPLPLSLSTAIFVSCLVRDRFYDGSSLYCDVYSKTLTRCWTDNFASKLMSNSRRRKRESEKDGKFNDKDTRSQRYLRSEWDGETLESYLCSTRVTGSIASPWKKEKGRSIGGEIYFGRTLPQYLTEVGLDLNTIHGNDGPVAAYRNVCHVPATVRGVE